MSKVGFAGTLVLASVVALARSVAADDAEQAAAALKQSYQSIDKIKDRAEQKAAADRFHAECEQFVRAWSGKITEGPTLAILGLAELALGNKDKSAGILARYQDGLKGKPAPALNVQRVIGEAEQAGFDLSSLKGKVVVVDFWATWCPPCRAAIPHLIDLQQKLGAKGVVVVGATQLYGNGYLKGERKANLDEAQEIALNADFKADLKIPYDIVVCEKGTSMFHYGVLGIPTLVLIDRAGNVRDIRVGASDFGAITLKVEELLDEQSGG
ncbi:MAG: TlpA disulfide reductase family protein [Planctomycetota bacterium]